MVEIYNTFGCYLDASMQRDPQNFDLHKAILTNCIRLALKTRTGTLIPTFDCISKEG